MGGDLRFLSHQETLRLFARACTRARIPVRHTEGFNPHPRISLPLPRPVGIASDAERAVFELTEAVDPTVLAGGLARQVPDGIKIHDSGMLDSQVACLPRLVQYSIGIDGVDRAVLVGRAARLMRCEPIPYDRFVHKKARCTRIDLRPYIDSIEVTDDEVFFTLHVTSRGSAKPAEICDVMGMGADNVNHLIRRRKIVW